MRHRKILSDKIFYHYYVFGMAKISGGKQNVLLPRWLNAYDKNMFLKSGMQKYFWPETRTFSCFLAAKFHMTALSKTYFHELVRYIGIFLLFSTFSPCFKKRVHLEVCSVCSFHNTTLAKKVFIIARKTLTKNFLKRRQVGTFVVKCFVPFHDTTLHLIKLHKI